jgi:hypothetical protein
VDPRAEAGSCAQRGSASARSLGRLGVVALCAAALLAGCGHKATEADCERIVVRITELELAAAQVSDPTNVNQQIERTKQTFAESVQRDCVGRRISDGTMACVDEATDAKQLVEECFD